MQYSSSPSFPASLPPSLPSPALLSEVLDGIKVYLDFTLEDHLLYGPEREQFKAVMGRQRSKGSPSKHGHPQRHDTENATDSNVHVQSPKSHLEHTPRVADSPALRFNSEPATGGNPWQPIMPSQVYGAEHLLRLFLKIPLFLSRAQVPSNHLQLLHPHFRELLAYLCSQRVQLFREENYDDIATLLGSVGGEEEEEEAAVGDRQGGADTMEDGVEEKVKAGNAVVMS